LINPDYAQRNNGRGPARICRRVAGAMQQAWQSYKDSQYPDLDEKEIKKIKLRQDAGKAAMAHMLLILKAAKNSHSQGWRRRRTRRTNRKSRSGN
jgi:hypothetical protein